MCVLKMSSCWYFYIFCCVDGSLYIGIIIDLEWRIWEYNQGKVGVKYMKVCRLVELVYFEVFENCFFVFICEVVVKKMSCREKLVLMK